MSHLRQTVLLMFGMIFSIGCYGGDSAASSGKNSAASKPTTSKKGSAMEHATLGGGCFWCLEAVYDRLNGVSEVVSGYAGGHVDNPTYELVCTGATGHAEVVQITFDPAVITYEDLLNVFFDIHDPTTLNRQGNDIGTQYRSVIFYHDEQQKATAGQVIQRLAEQKKFDDPIVTQLVPQTKFFQAEDYHQQYYERNSRAPYCRVVIDPKLKKLQKQHSDKIEK